MIIECPHCYNKVIPKSDDTCPSCKENTKEVDSNRLNYSAVTIKDNKILPEICYNCGDNTSNFINYKSKIGSNHIIYNIIMIIIGILFLPFGLFLFIKKGYKRKINIKVPICENCQNVIDVTPRYINFGKNSMNIIVHNKFKECLNK